MGLIGNTASESAPAVPLARAEGRRASVLRVLGRDSTLGYALLTPAGLYLAALLIYPLVLAIWFSLSSASVADPVGNYVGLKNYVLLLSSDAFLLALRNSFVFTFGSEVGKA